MSDSISMKLRRVGVLALGLSLAACATPPADDSSVGSTESALGEAGQITFDSAYHVQVTGALEKGKAVRIAYDANRLTACRGNQNGHAAWAITGYWRVGGGSVRSFEAGGFSPSNGTAQPVLVPDASGDLEIWFQNTSVWGCSAYDSAFGSNYHFAVQASATDPGWIGNPRIVTARGTCDGGPCDADMHPLLQDGASYDTWTRQRAAIRKVFFEVWKDGVTNWDNPDLWKQLDVQVHSRVGSSGAFAMAYVAFDRRLGNNARYSIDLRPLDPISGSAPTAADCPPFPLTVSSDYVQATVELYFTVNGVELRPAGGGTFHIRFENYKASFAACVP